MRYSEPITTMPGPSPLERKLETVEETDRPLLLEPQLSMPGSVVRARRAHKPVLRNGELDTECGCLPVDQVDVADHFEVRKSVRPCHVCFPDGFPFHYKVKQIGCYASDYKSTPQTVYEIPPELIPDGELFIGGEE